MKPIEPGCLCLAIDADLTHPQECRAVAFYLEDQEVPSLSPCGENIAAVSGWFVDRLLTYTNYDPDDFVPTKYLIRIDSDEEQFKQEQNERVADKLLEVM